MAPGVKVDTTQMNTSAGTKEHHGTATYGTWALKVSLRSYNPSSATSYLWDIP